MVDPSLDTVRSFLHVLAATVWVGGQLTLAGLVPALRRAAPESPRAAARAFDRLAWPAYGLLVATGAWNVLAVDAGDTSSGYQLTLLAKLTVVAVSGVAAALHTVASSRRALALWGAVSGASALGALFLGVLLDG